MSGSGSEMAESRTGRGRDSPIIRSCWPSCSARSVGGMTRWTTADLPDQTGRVAVVTGANTGVGLATARALVKAGAAVVLGCRDQDRADAAAAEVGGEPVLLDLGSLASVRAGAERITAAHPRIDLLINNAGVMKTPRDRTQD